MRSALSAVILGLLIITPASAQETTQLPEDCYLFCSFRGNGDGLHLAYSTDGIKWQSLANDRNYLTPKVGGKLMRDPCIAQGPDGTFHLVWTAGWWDKTIGYASSKDLMHWTEQKAIPVMEHEAAAKNSWAPEIVYDAARQQFMIYWATTIPGRFTAGETAGDKGSDGTMLNHRIYFTTTKDFETFAPTKLLFDPGFSCIDSTIVPFDGKYTMVFKDETKTPAKKYLQTATADSMEGPFKDLAETFTPKGTWVEGPSVIKIGDFYYCYFDMYQAHRYGAMRTKDFKVWEDLTQQLNFNVRDIRHGTAFKVKREILVALMIAAPAAQTSQSNSLTSEH